MEKAKEYLRKVEFKNGSYGVSEEDKALEIAYLEGMLTASADGPYHCSCSLSFYDAGYEDINDVEQRLKELLDE